MERARRDLASNWGSPFLISSNNASNSATMVMRVRREHSSSDGNSTFVRGDGWSAWLPGIRLVTVMEAWPMRMAGHVRHILLKM